MEERLLKLLDIEQLSSSKFADVIGVQRSSVSHILSGRNKPSFDFLQKTLKAFPRLNADWLILEEGKMYEGEDFSGGGSLFSQVSTKGTEESENTAVSGSQPDILSSGESNISKKPVEDVEIPLSEEIKEVQASGKNTEKVVKRVILLYSDNSFETFESF